MLNQENSSDNLWHDNAPSPNTKFLGIKPNESFFSKVASAFIDKLQAHNNFVGGLYATEKHLFTTSEDGFFKIWDRKNLELVTQFEDTATNNVKISPCQQYIATADDNEVVKIYTISAQNDTETDFRLLHTLYGHQGYVSRLVFADDKLISGSQDGTVKVWDYKNGKLLTTLEGHEEWVYALAVSPDNKKLMSAALNSTLKLWDLTTYELLKDVTAGSKLVYVLGMTIGGGNPGDKGNKNAVHEIAWIDDTKVITMAKDLVMWDTNTWEILWKVKTGSQYDLKSSAYIASLNLLITAGDVLEGWDVNTGKQLFAEVGHEGVEMYSCAYFFDKENMQDNHILYTGDKNGLIKIWSVTALMGTGIKQEHSNSLNEVKYIKETEVLMSSSYDDSIIVWDQNIKVIEKIKHPGGGAANFLATVPNKPHQLVWAWQGKIIVYDTEKQKTITKIFVKQDLVHYDNGVFINDEEILCFTLCYLPRVINIKTKEMTILELPFTVTNFVQYAPNKILLKTYPFAYLDRKTELLKLKKPYNWKPLFSEREFAKHLQEKRREKRKDSPFLLFDTAKLEIEKSFDAPKNLVFKDEKYACNILKVNENVYLTNYTNAVSVIWNIATSEILHTIQTEEEYINFIFVSGQYLYQLGESGNLAIFDKTTFELQQTIFLGDNIVRYLFCEEKNLFFYANKQGEIFGMDLSTCKNTVYAKIGVYIRCMDFADNTLFIGTDNSKVLSLSLV